MASPSTPAPSSVLVRLRRRCGAWLTGLGLLVLGAATIALLSPLPVFSRDLRVPVDASQATHDSGHSWIINGFRTRLPAELADLPFLGVLHEGERPLPQDDIHSNIREHGGGRWSLWGEHLYFSARNGGDPRSSGQRYAFVVAGGTLVPTVEWVLPAALGGVGVLLLGLLLSARLVATAVAAVVLAGIGHLGWDRLALLRLLPSLDHAAKDLMTIEGAPADPPAATRMVGNVTRLQPTEFQATGRLPDRPPPTPLVLSVEGTAPDDAGLLSLAPGGGRVVAVPQAPILAGRVGEILISGRITAGDTFNICLTRSDEPSPTMLHFDVPVRAAEGPQVVRIVNPYGVFTGSALSTLDRLEIRASLLGGPSISCTIDDVAIVDRRDAYLTDTHGQRAVQRRSTQRHGAWQSLPGSYRVALPADAGRLLKGALTLGFSQRAARATVSLESQDGSRIVLQEIDVPPHPDFVAWRSELPASGNGGTLILECTDLEPGAVLHWTSLRLVDASRPPQRVLLALMDTLRADMLGVIDPAAPPTPRFDALAAEGVAFLRCFSQSYWTRPSMASIMSGRYVESSGIHRIGQRLPDSYSTLVEAFADAGFYTSAVVSNDNAGSGAGLGQGWDELREAWALADGDAADYLRLHVEPFLQDLQDEDLFVYVHLMDAHGPYGPIECPSDWVVPPGQPVTFDPTLDRPWNPAPTDTSRVALYRSDVERLDAGFGAFLQAHLARWETPGTPPTIVGVMADHGEYLGEDGLWSHIDHPLLPAVTHVPLILRAPGRLPAGARIGAPVQNLDVAPTLLALCGIDVDPAWGWDGQDLGRVARGDAGRPWALSATGPGAIRLSIYSESAAVIGDRQDVLGLLGGDSPAVAPRGDWTLADQLLVDHHREAFLRAWSTYRQQGEAARASFWSQADEQSTVVDPEALRQLREMGYLR